MAMKHCSKCFEVLPMNDKNFYKRRTSKDGFRNDCIKCSKDQRKQYYDANKKELIKKQKEYYQKNKNEIDKWRKCWRTRNKVHLQSAKRRWHEENKNIVNLRTKKWKALNPERKSALDRKATHKRRSMIRGLVYTFTPNHWQQCLTHFNHQCAYCGSTESLEQEHVIPVSRGGHYTPDNIIPACRSCNASKNNKIMQDWFTQHENYSVERMANILKYVQKNKTEVNI